jgi:Sigma-70 region 2
MRRTDLTVDEREWLVERFEVERRRLRAVAYRMLGSVAEADDAVQEAWLRLGRSDASGIENLGGWLTTVVASRARRRVRGAPVPDADLSKQREVVDAFTAALREGGFEALVPLLDPDVVLRADRVPPGVPAELRGAPAVAERALMFSRLAAHARPILVNGAAGVVVAPEGEPYSVLGFTVTNGKIVEIDVFGDPQRLRQLSLAEDG